MKYVLFLLLVFLSACSDSKDSKFLFKEADIKSVLIINGKSQDILSKDGKILSHIKYKYEIAPEVVKQWFSDISQIEHFKMNNQGEAIDFNPQHTIEVALADETKWFFQGLKTAKSFIAMVKKKEKDKIPSGKIIHLTSKHYDRIFKTIDDLRAKRLPLRAVTKISYELDGKKIDLTQKDYLECIGLLREISISGYPYSGEVDSNVKNRFFINQAINSNIPGKLSLISKDNTFVLSFGKPSARDSLINLQIEGVNEIYSSKFPGWNRLESFLRQID